MQRILLVAVLAVCLYGSNAQGQVGKNETVLNPNRADTEQLLVLAQLDSALVEGIMEQRPFIGMEAFNTYLDSTLADSRSKPNCMSTSSCRSTSIPPATPR